MGQDGTKVETNLELLADVTPFILATDKNLVVTWASSAVLKRVPQAVGMTIPELIQDGASEEEISPETIGQQMKEVRRLFLIQDQSPIPLTGRWLPSPDGFILLATPGARTSEELSLFHLDDFTHLDQLVEELVGQDKMYTSLAEAISATRDLEARNQELEESKKELSQKMDQIDGQRRAILNMMKDAEVARRNLESVNADLESEVTERRRAEEQTLKANARLHYLLSSTSAVIYTSGTSGDYATTFISENVRQMTGYEAREFMENPSFWVDRIHPEDLKDVLADLPQMKEGKNFSYEYRFRQKDGTYIWVRDDMRVMRTGEGSPPEMIGFWTDITPHKEAEEKIKQQNEFLNNVLESLTHPFYVVDVHDYTIKTANSAAFENLLGVGSTCYAMSHARNTPCEGTEHPCPLQEVLKTKKPVVMEHIHYDKKGNPTTYQLNAYPVFDKEGNVVQMIEYCEDITERKQAEEKLRNRTKELNERVKELNCLYNLSRLILTPGIRLEQIFQGTVDLIPPAMQYPEITCTRLVVEGRTFTSSNFKETVWRMESDLSLRSDRVGTLEVYYLEEKPLVDEGPFLQEEKNLLNTIIERLARVIERQRAEEEIARLNTNLKMQAADLATANKELEAFSYSVSHDLRAPLRTADGFSRALMEDYNDKLDERGKEYLKRIRSATHRMGQLIDDLLDLSLTLRKEMRLELTDLSKLAKSITSELKRTQPDRQVEFVIQNGVHAYCDSRLLQELLENLLANAWKFTGRNKQARIEFGTTQKEDQKVYFVHDDGVGFDMNYVDKLFIPFQRLHSDSEFSGNGVGLALANRIVSRHGGRIWAESEVNKGATFYFTLK
jgi:PAS domain S-box-containing protein